MILFYTRIFACFLLVWIDNGKTNGTNNTELAPVVPALGKPTWYQHSVYRSGSVLALRVIRRRREL